MPEPSTSSPGLPATGSRVLRYGECDQSALAVLLGKYGLTINNLSADEPIPGSFWGGEEAGLIQNRVLVRADTPVHSVLHEACHYICMDKNRRTLLDTNAGGDYDEENAVCYLQILLAASLPDMSVQKMFSDMDAWGYSFRLGSSSAWFERDAEDAKQWLIHQGIIDEQCTPLDKLRN